MTETTPSTLKKILTALDIAAGALVAGNSMIGLPSQVVQALGGLCLVLTYLGYGNTKAQLASVAKAAALTLLIVMPIATAGALLGCSWFRGTVEPDINAVIDCGKQEATAQTIEDIVATFASAVASGNVAAAADGLVTKYGTQIVACSLAAIEKQPASGSAALATADPVAQAAAAAIASHGWKIK